MKSPQEHPIECEVLKAENCEILGSKQGEHMHCLSFYSTYIEIPSQNNGEEQEIKDSKLGKEEIQLSLLR